MKILLLVCALWAFMNIDSSVAILMSKEVKIGTLAARYTKDYEFTCIDGYDCQIISIRITYKGSALVYGSMHKDNVWDHDPQDYFCSGSNNPRNPGQCDVHHHKDQDHNKIYVTVFAYEETEDLSLHFTIFRFKSFKEINIKTDKQVDIGNLAGGKMKAFDVFCTYKCDVKSITISHESGGKATVHGAVYHKSKVNNVVYHDLFCKSEPDYPDYCLILNRKDKTRNRIRIEVHTFKVTYDLRLYFTIGGFESFKEIIKPKDHEEWIGDLEEGEEKEYEVTCPNVQHCDTTSIDIKYKSGGEASVYGLIKVNRNNKYFCESRPKTKGSCKIFNGRGSSVKKVYITVKAFKKTFDVRLLFTIGGYETFREINIKTDKEVKIGTLAAGIRNGFEVTCTDYCDVKFIYITYKSGRARVFGFLKKYSRKRGNYVERFCMGRSKPKQCQMFGKKNKRSNKINIEVHAAEETTDLKLFFSIGGYKRFREFKKTMG